MRRVEKYAIISYGGATDKVRSIMKKCSDDFIRFLYANYPDDYRRATAEDVPEDVLTAILRRHEGHYKVWENIPEWIKERYRDILPREVLDGNQVVEDFIEEEIDKANNEERETRAVIDYGIKLLALGYAVETVVALTNNREQRVQLLKEAGNNPLTSEQMAKWLETRENDCKLIKKDWHENQSEKYILHLVKETDREMRRAQKNGTTPEKSLEEVDGEIRRLMTRFASREDKMKMVDYLQQRPQQAALKHLSPEMQKRFAAILQENGIAMTPMFKRDMPEQKIERAGLAQSLKDNFELCKKMENILAEKYTYQNMAFQRAEAGELLYKPEQNKGVERLLALRAADNEKQRT